MGFIKCRMQLISLERWLNILSKGKGLIIIDYIDGLGSSERLGGSKSGYCIDVFHKLFAYMGPDDIFIVLRN